MTKQEIIELEKKVTDGDAMSMYSLGMAYFRGDGVEKDIQNALKYLIDSVWHGNASAAYEVALLKTGEYGLEANLFDSYFYCLHAVKAGNINAYVLLGDYYMHISELKDSITPYNPYTANLFYEMAAKEGNVRAMVKLSRNLMEGKGCVLDINEALYWSECAAEKGDVIAMYNTGVIYDGGIDSRFCNENKAGYWYYEAICHGNIEIKEYFEANFRFSRFSKKWKKVNI